MPSSVTLSCYRSKYRVTVFTCLYRSCEESGEECQDNLEWGELVLDPERDVWVSLREEDVSLRKEEDGYWVREVQETSILSRQVMQTTFKVGEVEHGENTPRSSTEIRNVFQ